MLKANSLYDFRSSDGEIGRSSATFAGESVQILIHNVLNHQVPIHHWRQTLILWSQSNLESESPACFLEQRQLACAFIKLYRYTYITTEFPRTDLSVLICYWGSGGGGS